MVEFALLVPVVALLLALIVGTGYTAVAQMVAVTSASQGARLGAAACEEQGDPAAVLEGAEQRTLRLLEPLSGSKMVEAVFDGADLVVTSRVTLLDGGAGHPDVLVIGHTARYYCGLATQPEPPPS